MKNVLFATLALLACFLPSCEKINYEEPVVVPVKTFRFVDAPIIKNTSYSYTLPDITKSTSYITMEASRFITSSISADANGNMIYQYTPETDYLGTDSVTITTAGELHNNKTVVPDTVITTIYITVDTLVIHP
jgi:hypothetical protein